MAPGDTAAAGKAPLAMRPQGVAGRIFGVLMELINAPAYRFALDLLELGPANVVLEIGFGTGRMIELLLAATTGRIAGVDPTPTMVEVASRRGQVRRNAHRVSLTLGSDQTLDFPEASFDRVVVLHAFQFWPDPERSLRRIRTLLRPGGRLVLVLRDHSARAPSWLPNPLSRQPDEAEAIRRLLAGLAFEAAIVRRGRMLGLVGRLPAAAPTG
ncbi:MAG TPA: class I SAM-dependent methyltransferase [Caulobacteraceae bacterium]|jgi:ubiquinone/menaquinone biosynthesis C-methylase UbiE